MSPRRIRTLVIVVFVGGIAGMIVGSIQDNNGTAITFGLLTAAAAVGLLLVTSVGGTDAFAKAPVFDDEAAAQLEIRIAALIAAGADEQSVRELVRESVRLGAARTR